MSFFDYHLPYFIILSLTILGIILEINRDQEPPPGFWLLPENFMLFFIVAYVLAIPYLFIYLIASVASAYF